jgi:hypothetical protein
MAPVDLQRNLLDFRTGKMIGKVEKNGNFMYHFTGKEEATNFNLGSAANGFCEVKDSKGKIVMPVHDNYKAQAACAYHCAQMGKEGKAMIMKK